MLGIISYRNASVKSYHLCPCIPVHGDLLQNGFCPFPARAEFATSIGSEVDQAEDEADQVEEEEEAHWKVEENQLTRRFFVDKAVVVSDHRVVARSLLSED